MELFKVVVAGGRDYNDFKQLTSTLDGLLRNKAKTHKIVIVSGKAKGADRLGERYAKLRGYAIEPHPADWKNLDVEGAVIKSNQYGQYNAMAGNMRNEDMAKVCDAVVAFWDGVSTGTNDMIGLAEKYKKPCRVIDY